MNNLPEDLQISYFGKEVKVSIEEKAVGKFYTVHLLEGDIKLKQEGVNTKLWIQKGKGATSLAYSLGQLIESCPTSTGNSENFDFLEARL